MSDEKLIPHLFRTEYRKIVSVLCRTFGLQYIEVAEDIVSETFHLAIEFWGVKGIPANPTAWLYAVAKNKTKDYLRRDQVFAKVLKKTVGEPFYALPDVEVDLSNGNIVDSQLQMMFAICDPCISADAQVGLALNILCGFGVEEIADAFLSHKDAIYKRLQRAKQRIKKQDIKIEMPPPSQIGERLENVLRTLYLLFSEGYYSTCKNKTLRKDLCLEAMRLNIMLVDNAQTSTPEVNALLSLMSFHSSRFDARTNEQGEMVLYEDQDATLWDTELIHLGEFYLNRAASGKHLSKYHLEAAIAYWHTHKSDSVEKWDSILQLYNKLLVLEYSPIAALNRTYALAKVKGKQQAIAEAEKLDLCDNHLYHSLLGHLYSNIDNAKALEHYRQSLIFAKSASDKTIINNNISRLNLQLSKI